MKYVQLSLFSSFSHFLFSQVEESRLYEATPCFFVWLSLLPSPADILSKSQAVFSDVQDDFSDVKKILSRFEEWRGSYSDSYHSAYISLCLPKLLNPIIRHQLLGWNPLKVRVGTNTEMSSNMHTDAHKTTYYIICLM